MLRRALPGSQRANNNSAHRIDVAHIDYGLRENLNVQPSLQEYW
jgi:hypothetical protein